MSGKQTIVDPLAKYINGELSCVLCQEVVKADAMWRAHLLGKGHKAKLEALRAGKGGAPAPRAAPAASAPKLAASSIASSTLPADFFETDAPPPAAKPVPSKAPVPAPVAPKSVVSASAPALPSVGAATEESAIPMGFFDDALTEMQVRKVKIEKQDFRCV